ncbi:helix-turn-helix domain-containing protein [Thiorhodococcus minor]|uniref:Helix-turn-helix domain-containing protein n=1 Tax=Thiorhodococcus minor TaxID=57489 RepID=A0A6M0JVG3_9GAMM|nr:helix-turn-helix domain-containing protein [Thiorhodococcus minor]NEV61520.1 helix-turn-helix domain-containing protein [Thiorhodococcus minor]
MSFEAMRWALYRPGLTLKAKVVLIALADCCKDRGSGNTCWPGAEHLMSVTGLSHSSVSRAIKELASTKPPTILCDYTLGKTTRYTLPVDDAEVKTHTKSARMSEDEPHQLGADACLSDADHGQADQGSMVNLTRGYGQADQGGYSQADQGYSQPDYRTSKEPVNNPLGGRERESSSRAREISESASKTLSQTPEGECSHDQAVHIDAVTLDWQEIARALRPDIAAKPTWEKFRVYHQSQTLTAEEWDARWRLWILRERNNCQSSAILAYSNNPAPGRLTAMLGGQAIDATRYEVIEQ